MSTLTQTLSILASHPLAKSTYKVCLAMEEREAGSRAKGDTLRTQYVDKFRDITVSIHPSGLPGEVPGKGSNVGWGARWLVEREFIATASEYDDDEDEDRASRLHSSTIPEGILTVMDADTAFASDYFLAAAAKYLLARPEKRERMMFVPPIIFDRNQADVPGITRITDIMWAAVYVLANPSFPTRLLGSLVELEAFTHRRSLKSPPPPTRFPSVLPPMLASGTLDQKRSVKTCTCSAKVYLTQAATCVCVHFQDAQELITFLASRRNHLFTRQSMQCDWSTPPGSNQIPAFHGRQPSSLDPRRSPSVGFFGYVNWVVLYK
jgi:hypothetical protein